MGDPGCGAVMTGETRLLTLAPVLGVVVAGRGDRSAPRRGRPGRLHVADRDTHLVRPRSLNAQPRGGAGPEPWSKELSAARASHGEPIRAPAGDRGVAHMQTNCTWWCQLGAGVAGTPWWCVVRSACAEAGGRMQTTRPDLVLNFVSVAARGKGGGLCAVPASLPAPVRAHVPAACIAGLPYI